LHENGLRGFRSKVSRRVGIIVIRRGTHLGFEHEFEVPGLGEERTIFWIVVCDFFFLGCGFSNQDEFLGRDLLIREELGVKLSGGFPRFVFILIRLVQKDGIGTIDRPSGLFMGSAGEVVSDAGLWFDLVSAQACFREEAITHRIRESTNVSRGRQDGLMSENGSIESEDIIAFQYVFSPPQIFEVPFDLSAEGAVIPASVQPAVDFGGLEDESFAFAQGNNLFHAIGVGLVFIGHGFWARIFPAGREETGEMPQGKVFLKAQ
jgi:hypothetical protein